MVKNLIMDKVIITKARVKKCGTCAYANRYDLQDVKTPSGWIYCTRWNGQKNINGVCSEWRQ